MTPDQLHKLMLWVRFLHIDLHSSDVSSSVHLTEATKELYQEFGFKYCPRTGRALAGDDPQVHIFKVNGSEFGPMDALDMLGRLQELRDSWQVAGAPASALLLTNTISMLWHMADHTWGEHWQEVVNK